MNPSTNCPYCGSKLNFNSFIFACGSHYNSLTFSISDLCREREARQKAEAENAKLRELLAEALAIEPHWVSGEEKQKEIREKLTQLTK